MCEKFASVPLKNPPPLLKLYNYCKKKKSHKIFIQHIFTAEILFVTRELLLQKINMLKAFDTLFYCIFKSRAYMLE